MIASSAVHDISKPVKVQARRQPVVNLCFPGWLDYADSYGLIACHLARELHAMGVYVNTMGLAGEQFINTPDDIAAVAMRPIRAALGGIILGWPSNYRYHSALVHAGPRVAISMFESSKIPDTWIEPLNSLDAVITPSHFCKDVFETCGVTVPIHVVPLGVSEVFRPGPRKQDRPYTFLAFLDRGRRKGGLAALNAFVRAFGDNMDYRLLLKARAGQAKGVSIVNPNVDMLFEDLSEEELRSLYLEADVVLAPALGEGFGLIPREAAACGCVAMATGWSGLADDIWEWGVPLPYKLIPADWRGEKRLQGLDLGQWAEVDVKKMAAMMRKVAEHRDILRQEAEQKAAWVRKHYSWRLFAQRVYSIWQEVSS